MIKTSIRELMATSGVKFGTSGARGLAADMTDRICYSYTKGFVQHLRSTGEWRGDMTGVAVAGDLRPSTGRIMRAVFRAVEDQALRPINCGRIPSPAVALHGLIHGIPAIMVTGSHIPADRNGIKFNKCSGEILKDDEAGMCAQKVDLPEGLFDSGGAFVQRPSSELSVHAAAGQQYANRYLDAFGSGALAGRRIGLYQHSAVGRQLVAEILRGLGADVTPLGWSDEFVPVDTEAIRPEDVQLAAAWAREHRLDAIVSTDGDSDRPLVSDEQGRWLRGDVAGVLCARFLGADSVSTPVSCNSAVEKSGWFKEVRRTRIGSPFVVSSMLAATAAGGRCVVGYEANGGFLLNSNISINGQMLRALPTRDAMIVLISILLLAGREKKRLSELVRTLPQRFTTSGLMKNCPPEVSQAIVGRFSSGDPEADQTSLQAVFGSRFGPVLSVDRTDGVRVTFENGEVAHLRPSGNAPEFRCYNEAASQERAEEMNEICLGILRQLR